MEMTLISQTKWSSSRFFLGGGVGGGGRSSLFISTGSYGPGRLGKVLEIQSFREGKILNLILGLTGEFFITLSLSFINFNIDMK